MLGAAWMRDADGGIAPSESPSARVHVIVTVSLPMTRNVADGGIVRHASCPASVPRSSDQSPPGVFGCVLGKPSTSSESHWPCTHVLFVTRKVTDL